ncbi:DUF2087 domain-containing protein [Streptomyces sp. A3M-1-3]|nr:DUF2087 domain-containing protein [Streptomyces sp. A3M-1-3]MCP3820935.1 DUF2087 domain-containing protein [Streptomyces sp. A3M-1-3]
MGTEPVDREADCLPPQLQRLFSRGRLTAIPVRTALRRELLEYLAESRFEPGRSYSEAEVNEAIQQVHDDSAALRRYLVIDGLLSRTRDGSGYQLA